jgi:hypothetical protein
VISQKLLFRAKQEDKMSKSRFSGALLGHLMGDCLGSPFEMVPAVTNLHLNRYFAQLQDPNVKGMEMKLSI